VRVLKDIIRIQNRFELAQPLGNLNTIIQLVRLLSGVGRIDVVGIRSILGQVVRHRVVEFVDELDARGRIGLVERGAAVYRVDHQCPSNTERHMQEFL